MLVEPKEALMAQVLKMTPREFPSRKASKPSGARYSFACSDVGYKCDWRVEAATEDELMDRVEEHGRMAHNFQQLSDQKRFKLRNNIHRAA
jgi:predicted small metal-binding protein